MYSIYFFFQKKREEEDLDFHLVYFQLTLADILPGSIRSNAKQVPTADVTVSRGFKSTRVLLANLLARLPCVYFENSTKEKMEEKESFIYN